MNGFFTEIKVWESNFVAFVKEKTAQMNHVLNVSMMGIMCSCLCNDSKYF